MKNHLSSSTVGLALLALTFGACSSQRQTHASVPAPARVDTVGVANMQAATSLPDTPTASDVAISPILLRACRIDEHNAYFAFDSSDVTAFDRGPLDDLATCFISGPMSGRKLLLVGHTSRAQAVADYLVGQGVSPANVPSTSRGAMDATGRDEAGRARDRRVDALLAK